MAAGNMWRRILLSGSCALLLSGCSTWLKDLTDPDSHPASAPQPQMKIVQTPDSTYMQPVGKPVVHLVPEPSDTDEDALKRIGALERQVGQMRNDMDTMMPVLTRLVAVQTDIQTMLARLEQKNANAPVDNATAAPAAAMPANGPPAPPPSGPVVTHDPTPIVQPNMAAAEAPMASAPPPPQAAETPPAPSPAATMPLPEKTPPPASPAPEAASAPSGIMIKDVRLGEHPGKTRIVLDVSDKVAFSNDIDNDEHILTIDLKGAGWTGAAGEKPIKGSPLLSSWQAGSNGQGGTRIIMQLRKSAKIAATQTIPGGKGQNARIVIDLTPL
jgi:hypothetical protein